MGFRHEISPELQATKTSPTVRHYERVDEPHRPRTKYCRLQVKGSKEEQVPRQKNFA